MKILGVLLITVFLLGCGPSKREVELESQLKELKAALEANEAKAKAKEVEETAKAKKEAKAEEEAKAKKEARAKQEAHQQSAELKAKVLALAHQMASKEYKTSGLFKSDEFGKLLKKSGYDEDLRMPAKDVRYFVGLFNTLVQTYPKAAKKPSVLGFNRAVEQWADWKRWRIEKLAILVHENPRGFALIQQSIKQGTKIQSADVKVKNIIYKNDLEKETFLDSIKKLFD